MSFLPPLPIETRVVEAMMESILHKENGSQQQQSHNDDDAEEIVRIRESTAELSERFAAFFSYLERKEIETFAELAEKNEEAKKLFILLAQQTAPAKLDGFHIALFGLEGTGKSTMLDALLGQNVAAFCGEATLNVKAYLGTGYTLWDTPCRTYERSYMSMEYISFFKGLSRRLILIRATVKEKSSMMKLLDELNLEYDIVFSKFDTIFKEDQPLLKEHIKKEIQTLGLRKVGKVYYVSAKHPKMSDDWLELVNHLTC